MARNESEILSGLDKEILLLRFEEVGFDALSGREQTLVKSIQAEKEAEASKMEAEIAKLKETLGTPLEIEDLRKRLAEVESQASGEVGNLTSQDVARLGGPQGALEAKINEILGRDIEK